VGPSWSDDHPADTARIIANVTVALSDVASLATARAVLTAADLRRWHSMAYGGCTVPSLAYVGGLRGDAHPDLVDYDVGVGPDMPDGLPDRVGVWASTVTGHVALFFDQLRDALTALDAALGPSARPDTVDLLQEVVTVIALAHGEWLRIHPFVNGNGRTARLIAAHISLRYNLPVFVMLKPRPHDVAYARASRQSMGRPPNFIGDHTEAVAVFGHLLALHLLGR
jgi:hypothetical protein